MKIKTEVKAREFPKTVTRSSNKEVNIKVTLDKGNHVYHEVSIDIYEGRFDNCYGLSVWIDGKETYLVSIPRE